MLLPIAYKHSDQTRLWYQCPAKWGMSLPSPERKGEKEGKCKARATKSMQFLQLRNKQSGSETGSTRNAWKRELSRSVLPTAHGQTFPMWYRSSEWSGFQISSAGLKTRLLFKRAGFSRAQPAASTGGLEQHGDALSKLSAYFHLPLFLFRSKQKKKYFFFSC